MVEDFAPLNLRARLSALQDRIAEARTKLEAHGAVGEHSEELTKFATQHDAIRGSLDSEGTVTELQHSKATVQTDSLEKELELLRFQRVNARRDCDMDGVIVLTERIDNVLALIERRGQR